MRTRNRDRERDRVEAPPEPGAGASSDAESTRRRARELLAAGDDIIDRALSGDSLQFLAQNRQQGGQ